jgi:hypothetical protein
MRQLIVMFLVFGSLALTSPPSEAARGEKPEHVQACEELRPSSRGLYGLCVAFCRQQDLSHVDLNDIASVRAAAPDIAILREYNDRRRPSDPEMPCLQNNDPSGDDPTGSDIPGGDDDPSGGGDPGSGSDGPSGDIPPAECPCWTGAELAAIDGELPPMDGMTATVDCTALDDGGAVYRQQVREGYDLGFTISVERVAWASVSTGGPDPYDGCFISSSDGLQRNFPLETADAEKCVQEIAAHCDALGNP